MLTCSSRLTTGAHIEADKNSGEVVQMSERLLLDERIDDNEFGNFGRGCLIPPVIIGLARMLVSLGDEKSEASAIHTSWQQGLQQ